MTLTAQSSQGYTFKGWQVESGNVEISNNQFTMPAEAVSIKAVFEKNIEEPKPVQYAIQVTTDGEGTASSNTTTAKAGETVTLTAQSSQGYTFKGWQVESGDVEISNNQFIMPVEAVSIKAVFEKNVEEPIQPEQPAEPTNPETPIVDPVLPVEPNDPIEPTKPEEPKTPEENKTNKETLVVHKQTIVHGGVHSDENKSNTVIKNTAKPNHTSKGLSLALFVMALSGAACLYKKKIRD